MNIAFSTPIFLWLWVYSWPFVWNRERSHLYTHNTLHQSVGKHWQQEGRHVSSVYFVQVFCMCLLLWGKVWSQLDPNARLHFQQHSLLSVENLWHENQMHIWGDGRGRMLFTPPHALWVGGEGVAPCVFILDNHVVQPRWHALLNRFIFSYITAGGLLAWFKNIVPSSHKELTNSTTSVMRCKNAAFDYLLL